MKKAIFFAFLVIAICGSSFAQEAQKPVLTEAEKEVMKLERQWLDAYEQNNPDEMERIMTDDFIITFPNGGRQTKKQIVGMTKSLRSSSQPKMRFYTEDVQSRVYGDTVILMGRVISEYERDGKQVKEQYRYTDTYVKRNNRWQVAASHLSNVEEGKPPAQK